MRFLYVLLFVPFTAAVPFPSTHLAITGLNARAMDGPRDSLGGPHVPTVTFSQKFKAILPETKQTHMTYAQNFNAALDNNHPLKGASHINWESPSRFQYHSGVPKQHNKIGEAQFKSPTVGYSLKNPQSTDGIEAKVHALYADFPVNSRYKIATHADVFKGWHQQDASDRENGQERAVFQLYRGGVPNRGGKKVGTAWEVFRPASERSPHPASGSQSQRV